jgi:hypothetical protein
LKGLVSRQAFIRSRPRLSAVLVLLVLAVPLVSAQTKSRTPEGIPAGRWFLAPTAFIGIGYDTNVFRRSSESDNVISDLSQRTTLGLVATLPVRNSALVLDYLADRRAYQTIPTAQEWSHDLLANWRMRLSSADRLNFRAQYILGITDTQVVDPGGELTFDDIPYELARFGFDISRDVPNKPGYSFRINRSELTWDPRAIVISRPERPTVAAQTDTGRPDAHPPKTPPQTETVVFQNVPFFDYTGWDGAGEYLHPLSPTKWLIGFGSFRRFDHFRPRGDPEYDPGVPYRSEESGSIQVGMRGDLGLDQPFFFRLGYGRFRFTGEEFSPFDYNGLVGQADWLLRVGGRSRVALGWNLRPLPSSFSTFYVVNEFTATFDRDWLVYSKIGIDLLYSRNRYGDVLFSRDDPPIPLCGGQIREDQRWITEGFVDWAVHRKFGLRVALGRYGRDSNCEGVDYKATVLTSGFTLGWF